jgi:hyperosmotically inducible periplasmic protein
MLKKITSIALGICAITLAQSYTGPDSNKVRTQATGSSNAADEPDNSKVNKRDMSDSTITPLNQGNSKADIDLTRKIRHAVYGDSTLSTLAHNIKIITWEGKVTLRGPVKTESEKSRIVAKAHKIAGSSAVVDQLEIAGK